MSLRWLGLRVGLIGFALALPVLYSVHAVMPSNVITLPGSRQIRMVSWVPQGWKFFTRDPREPDIHLYRLDESGSWQSAALSPNLQVRYALGLNRKPRAQGVEMGLLLYELDRSAWTACETDPTECLEANDVVATLVNQSPSPSLCGQIGFVQQEPPP